MEKHVDEIAKVVHHVIVNILNYGDHHNLIGVFISIF